MTIVEQKVAESLFKQFNENASQEIDTGALTLETWIMLQRRWSEKTFGTKVQRGPTGPLLHLKKEIDEILEAVEGCNNCESESNSATQEQAMAQLHEEVADLIFLIFDAAWRAGMSIVDIRTALTAKLLKNQFRSWPPINPENADKPVEHDRTKDIGGEA